MGHKAFKRAQGLEPIWIELGEDEVRFDCEDDIPGGLILDFAAVMDGGGNIMGAVKDFFDNVIVEDQREQFWALIHDKKAGIGLSVLMELAQWLAEEYAGRPTGQSSAGGSPKTPTGAASTPGALHGVPTYSRAEPAAAST